MAGLGPVKVGLALVFVFSVTLDQATSDDKCRTGCGGVTPHYFKFAEGTTYKYNYEGNIDILVSSVPGQHSTTKVRATVLLTQLGQCEQILRIQNFQVVGGDGKKHTNIADIGRPVKLNFHDGHVEDLICTEEDDSQNSLNVKRAVASLFQAAIKSNYETDVFGVCPTDISTRKEGNAFVIRKNRNLNKCAHRETFSNDFMATAFNLNSEIKTSPFLKGEYSSEQRIKNGILDHVTITENYLYVPYSVGTEGAKAQVQSKLTLAGQTKEKVDANCKTPRSIIFENPHPLMSATTNVNTILKAVKDTAEATGITVKEDSAEKFANLVHALRTAKKADLLTVYNQVRAGAGFSVKEEARQIFLEGLFRAGTGDTIEVGIELYQKKQLTDLETRLFFLGLSFSRHVTSGALKSAAGIVKTPELPREALLGIGILVNRYCRLHSCENVGELNALMNTLLAKISVKTVHDRKAENDVIAVLKAIANTKYIPDNLVAKIVALAQDKNGPIRIRVAALETYLGNPCNDKFRDSALNILKDIQQDSEIRIKAYLAATQCPNGKVANAIKRLLEDEPSYQVGGFIVTHLQTIKTSANPDKALAKAQLGQITTTRKFPFDVRKYSFNAEFSEVFDTLGLGSSTEGNVIYSQKSFFPRSISLNLTAELFGHTFNFLEIDTRQENLDRLLEHYVGPLGVLRKESPENLYGQGKKGAENLVGKIGERFKSLREKRDVTKAQLDSINRQVHSDKQNELNRDLDLDFSIKLFGSEALFLSFNEDNAKYTPEGLIDKIFDEIERRINEAKSFDRVFRSNVMFMDSEVSYPTSLGFPFRLDMESISSIQVKTAGNIDVKSILQTDNSKVKFSLIPSVTWQADARMTLDAGVVQSGLKLIGRLHSATGASLDLVSDSAGLDVKVTLPVDNQKIVLITHDLVLVTRELGSPETIVPIKFTQNKDFSVCVDHLSPLIGLTFCAEINQPNAALNQDTSLSFPFSGNSKVAVYIEKSDLEYYRFKISEYLSEDKNGLATSFEVIGQQNKKKLDVKFELFLKPEAYVKLVLESSLKTAILEGRITFNDREKSILGRAGYDTFEYYGKIGVLITGNPQRLVYKPVIEYKAGEQAIRKSPYNVEGQIIVEPHGELTKYTFDNVKIINPGWKTITISGHAESKGDALSANLRLSDGEKSGSFKGSVEVTDEGFKLDAELQNSINPQANFNVKYDCKYSTQGASSDLQVIHGKDLSPKNAFKLFNSYKLVSSKLPSGGGEKDELAVKNHLSYPVLGISTVADLEITENKLKYDVDLTYKEIKLGSELELKVKEGHSDYDLEFELYGFNNKLEIDSHREVNGYKSKIKHKIAVNDKALEVAGTVNHLVQDNNINIGSDLAVKLTGHPGMKYVSSYKYVPGELDISIKLTSGGTAFIDVYYKVNKAEDHDGSVKINFKDYLIADGQVKATKGKGSGHIVLELPKHQRKIKSESTFTVQDPAYNLDLTLYTNWEKDNKRKYRLSTQNTIKDDSLDTKNTIDILGQVYEIKSSLKGKFDGGIADSSHNLEFDVTFPSQYYLSAKWDRDFRTTKGAINGEGKIILEQRDNKNTPGRKLTFKGQVKDTTDEVHDVNIQLAIDSSVSGKNLNTGLAFKGRLKGDALLLDWRAKIQGSLLPETFEATLDVDSQKSYDKIKTSYKYGKLASLDLNGKLDIPEADDVPATGDLSISLTTPNAKIRTVRFTGSFSALVPEADAEFLDVKGSSNFFIDDDGTDKDPTFDIKTEAEVKLGRNNGYVKGSFNSQDQDPIAVSGKYAVEQEKFNGDASVQYGKGKKIKTDLTWVQISANEYKLDASLDTPHEKAKNTRLQVHEKISDSGENVDSEIAVTVNGNRYVLNHELVLSDSKPAFDVRLKYPNGKVDVLSAKVTKIGEKLFAGSAKLVFNEKDFTFDGSVDVNAQNIEDFSLELSVDSPALKANKFVLHANTKEAKGAKKIFFNAKEAGKSILNGHTTYKVREEGGKFVIEGSGTFQLRGESKTGNFKYIRQNINNDVEKGIEISLDAALGNKAIDAELKLTNKQFRFLDSYCEEKKQCAHIEIDAKTTTDDYENYNNVVEVNVDLRKLGLSHECGLKAVTTRKGFFVDHTVDVHFQSKENKYQYSLYVHPKKAGASLTTPKRIVSLEGNLQQSGNDQQIYPIKGDVVLYLNKKTEPNKKTAFTFALDNKETDAGSNMWGELTLTHPAIKKTLSYTFTLDYDVKARKIKYHEIYNIFPETEPLTFDFTAQAIVDDGYGLNTYYNLNSEAPWRYVIESDDSIYIDYSKKYVFKYSSKVLETYKGEKYATEALINFDPRNFNYRLKYLNKDLLDVKTTYKFTEKAQSADVQISGLIQPISAHLEAKNYNSLSVAIFRPATPNKKLQLSTAFIPGQIADFRVYADLAGKKSDLVHAYVKLDEADFLKSDYALNADHIKKYLIEPLKSESEKFAKEANAVVVKDTEAWKEFFGNTDDDLERTLPDLKAVAGYYVSELEKLKEEVVTDKSIKEIGDSLSNVFGAIVQALTDLFQTVAKTAGELFETLRAKVVKILESLEKDFLPKLQELLDQLAATFLGVFEAFSNAVLAVLTQISDFLDSHEEELKKIATAISSAGQDVGRFVLKSYEQIRTTFITEFNKLVEELRALPVYEELKKLFNDLGMTLAVLPAKIQDEFKENGYLNNFVESVKDLIKKEDIKEHIEAILEYIEKFPGVANLLYAIPRVVASKSSVANRLVGGHAIDVHAILFGLDFNPRSWILPYRLHAIVVQGQHIFTFDGKHLTFPGNCNYLLARDVANGNFSIVGTYVKGFLTAITIADKTDTITVKSNGQVTLNYAAAEFPVRRSLLDAYRTYNSVNIVSKAGARVECSPELTGCLITISGFYHGQLKGLLGNGNNEAYDDYTLPNGKIVTSESDFGNAYKVQSNCAPVKTVDHTTHSHSKSCGELFGEDSDLLPCFYFVNRANFRQACEHGVNAGIADTEKYIAAAYVTACNLKFIPVELPDKFVTCTNGDKPVPLGEQFSVKIPQKSADIVIAVDLVKSNEVIYKDLVIPTIAALSKELGDRGIKDVKFHVITYGGNNQKYPSHVTTHGGKMSFASKPPTLKFSEVPESDLEFLTDVDLGHETANFLLSLIPNLEHDLNLALGNTVQAKAYEEAMKYPFRPKAIKAMIAVTGEPCEEGALFLLQQLRAYLVHNDAISLHLITPLSEFKVKDEKTSKTVIGFNENSVLTLPECRKNPLGNRELRGDLDFDDYCVDFTLESGGNVFITNNFEQAKGNNRKLFVSTVAYNIAETLATEVKGLDCECEREGPYSAQIECTVEHQDKKPPTGRKLVMKG